MRRYPVAALALGAAFGFGAGFFAATWLMEHELNEQVRRIGRNRAELTIKESTRIAAAKAAPPTAPPTARPTLPPIPTVIDECISEVTRLRQKLVDLQLDTDRLVNDAQRNARESDANTRTMLDINAGLVNDNALLRQRCK